MNARQQAIGPADVSRTPDTAQLDIPPLGTGETLYSALARGRERIGYSTYMLAYRAFGCRFVADPLFGTRLGMAAEQLHKHAGWNTTAEELLKFHTAWPLLAPFTPAAAVRSCTKTLIEGGKAGRIFANLRFALGIEIDSKIRFCRICRKRDVEKWGEARIYCCHQFGPLKLCPEHMCALCECELGLDTDCYIALDEVKEARELHVEKGEAAFQKALREGVLWLFGEGVGVTFDRPQMWEAYRNAAGVPLGCRLGPVRVHEDFISFFGTALMQRVGLEKPAALTAFVAPNPRGPIPLACYFLLALRLRVSLRSLVERCKAVAPPEKGPWPCLNPHCTDYEKDVIVSWRRWWRNGERAFTCGTCGRTYVRPLPLTREPGGAFRYRVIEKRDDDFDERLRGAWGNPRKDWKALSSDFSLSISSLRYIAASLGLPNMPGRTLDCRKGKARRFDVNKLRRKHRRLYKTLRPGKQLSYTISWLKAYDTKWLLQHPRDRSKPERRSHSVDWTAKDNVWSRYARKYIPGIIKALQRTSLHQIKIHTLAAALERKCGRRFPHRCKHKLPATMNYLNEHTESSLDRLRRRVEFLVAELRRKGVRPSLWRFRRQCGASEASSEQARAILEGAYERLRAT